MVSYELILQTFHLCHIYFLCQREKEKLHRKILELEKQLDADEALKLEIQRLKGALQIMQHMEGDEDTEMKRKMEAMQEELNDKEEELQVMEHLNRTLLVKERINNDELQGARKELINVSIFYLPHFVLSFFFLLFFGCIKLFIRHG